jgi:hypothetical protein
MTKFHTKPETQRIKRGPMSTATAATSTVATADVMRKSREEEAMRSIIDASMRSLIVSILSMINWKNKVKIKILASKDLLL